MSAPSAASPSAASRGELTVVKCGGTAGVDAEAVCADVADLVRAGQRVVLVHGGSADIGALGTRLGVPERRMISDDGVDTRYTDPAALEVVVLALAGAVKPRLVAALARAGVDAVGLTGLDAGLLRARRTAAYRAVVDGRRMVLRDNHGGRLIGVRAELLRVLLAAGTVPVVSPPALGEDGRPVNVDADRAAAALAAALGARTLVLLTGAPGVLADPADERSVLPSYALPPTGAPPGVGGGMAMKLIAGREALLGGVGRVLVADGRHDNPVRAAFTGAATEITTRSADA
ncbi:[LysW]-aminoadipate kinase [Micromonospora sp. CPCC 205539]|uniref:[LysW]-aminoadipate kinase n=1 Tax=Micromonospora sp. CPCC 205539 TaxID=3122408 RepID=UPI002FF424A3